MAIYTFGSSATNTGLSTIQTLTSNLTTAKNSAANIDLMTVPYQNYQDDTQTDFPDLLTSVNNAITTPGTQGTDPGTGKNIVRCQEPLDPSYCTTMKNRGIKIAVLYTTYLPITANPWYNTWIAPFSSSIASNMQACAS